MTPFFQKLLRVNWLLVIAMFGILIFGVYSIESAARHLPVPDGAEGGPWYAKRQQLWILLGVGVYAGTALIDYRLFKFLGIPMYIGGIVLMVAALKFGNEVHQLKFGPISFQPAQFMVVAGIILLGFMLQDLPRWHQIFKIPLVLISVILLLAAVPFLLYVVMPKVSKRGAGRIELFIDSKQGREIDIKGAGYAQHNVKMAVGKSGYKGIGHNAGADKGSLHAGKWIPWKTAHNDFIFAVIAEEQGFRGTVLLVTAFGFLVIQCIYISYYSRDMSGQVLCCAIGTLFAAHVFQNIGMCVELLPITGIPLPLVSYSGTFVLMCMFMLGLVQSVWIHRRQEIPELQEKPVELSIRE